MSELQSGPIPVDSLAVSRKMMNGSRTTLEGRVHTAVHEHRLRSRALSVRERDFVGITAIEPEEYGQKKFEHPRLAAFSVVSLASGFKEVIRRRALTDYISGVGLGSAEYDETEEGLYVVGFTMSDEFRERIKRERTDAIDMLLDEAGLPIHDEFRHWRNEEADDLWVPVLDVTTNDPDAENMMEEFTDALTEQTAQFAVDFWETQANSRVAYLPPEALNL